MFNIIVYRIKNRGALGFITDKPLTYNQELVIIEGCSRSETYAPQEDPLRSTKQGTPETGATFFIPIKEVSYIRSNKIQKAGNPQPEKPKVKKTKKESKSGTSN